MRVWLTTVIVLFVLAQFYQWAKHLTLPSPVFILAGVLLAIASNYDKRSGWPFRSKISASTISQPLEPTVLNSVNLTPDVSIHSHKNID